ncbi:hypothetical protein A0H81_10629 [Grifola frondosa]|uniref:Uncharacterized protein n=1 Tax=Grifola frondosa TaxID=5627 RepID=A0A1C7LXZ9_GRIFR|nr:hypothetical protein A0H81_10629 [Grifola frondosa]
MGGPNNCPTVRPSLACQLIEAEHFDYWCVVYYPDPAALLTVLGCQCTRGPHRLGRRRTRSMLHACVQACGELEMLSDPVD